MSRPEYTWAVESANGEKAPDPLNPTNNIVIPINMPRLRTPTLQIYLGSVELPLSQYVIEQKWNTLYYSDGLRIIVDDESESPNREFTVQFGTDSPITASIPPLLNPIIDIDLTSPTDPIFTTLFEHNLELRGQWDWGQPIKVINTPLVDPDIINLTSTNPNLVILSPTQFQLLNTGVVTYVPAQPPPYAQGFVWAPPIASPLKLAEIVQSAFNLVAPGVVNISYSVNTGRFTIRSTIKQSNTCVTDPPLEPVSMTIYIPSRTSLPAIMGFGLGNIRILPNEYNEAILEGGYGYQCFSQIQVTPGNYTASDLARELQLEWSRFNIDSSVNGCIAASTTVFVFASPNGTCYSITIPGGMYTPDTFADYLQGEMNTLDSNNNYTVTYDFQSGLFCISGIDAFALEFASETNTFNPAIIGFDALSYRGKNSYCSPHPFQVPVSSCCGSPNTRYSSLIFLPRVNSSQGKFVIPVSQPRVVPTVGFLDLGDGTGRFTSIGPIVRAHGVQPDDVIAVNVASLGTTTVYYMKVVQVEDAFNIVVHLGTIDPAVFGIVATISYIIANPPTISFLWADRNRPNRMYPRFLGFNYTDYIYSPAIQEITSLFSYDLDPCRSVLLVIDDPNGATHTNHAWRQDNIANVFAKIILYPQFRLERNYPMIMYLPDTYQLTRMRFRFVNPEEHTLYEFHGKQWSATINFVVTEAQLQTACS